jgi:hypothetical protein
MGEKVLGWVLSDFSPKFVNFWKVLICMPVAFFAYKLNISTVHLDTLGMIHDSTLIAAI